MVSSSIPFTQCQNFSIFVKGNEPTLMKLHRDSNRPSLTRSSIDGVMTSKRQNKGTIARARAHTHTLIEMKLTKC